MSLFKALDPKVQERWRIQRQLKNALLGYSTLELVQNEDRLVFGTWNPRQLQPKQIRRLTKSFQSDGLDRFDLKSVMPIVVPKDSIDLTSLTLDPSEPSKLTELKLQPNCHGMAIKCAGGKHRLQALKLYLRDLRSAQDDLIREQDRIAGIPDEEISNEDKRRFKKVLPEAMKKLQGIQNYGGQWMVAVYDEGEMRIDRFNHTTITNAIFRLYPEARFRTSATFEPQRDQARLHGNGGGTSNNGNTVHGHIGQSETHS